ncbi:MAG: hypothetical protein A2Y40_08815 [Candidatus Margulisbacteria bacterium GWF2_35_9]|nr:MAG: hypothetical protein A2Y40_08815 [Candidatus Margulisbacteria bacterium GWF2_35_9]
MIKIKSLIKTYGDQTILKDLNIKIPKGKKTTIIGQSGCGKSTLLRLILGLEKFDEGEIWVGKDCITHLSEDDLNKVRLQFGMVFQSAALFDSMTVGENVGLVLKEHTDMTREEIKERVIEKLGLVGLNDIYDAYPANLSGGMKKRVAFARAIVNNPKVLLFDEPTTGLDPVTSTRVENLINKLTKKTNATTIVVTHQISTILNVSENIVMIHDGEAIKTEGPDKILKSKNKMVYNFVNGLIK